MLLRDLRTKKVQALGWPLKAEKGVSLLDSHVCYEVTVGMGYELVVSKRELNALNKLIQEADSHEPPGRSSQSSKNDQYSW